MKKSYIVFVEDSTGNTLGDMERSGDMIPLRKHEHFYFEGDVHNIHDTYEKAEAELQKYFDWIHEKSFHEDYTQSIHMYRAMFEIRTIYTVD